MGSNGGGDDGPDPRRDKEARGEDEDKVIRLPRDWLGPRDELVPFGPSAEGGGQGHSAPEPPFDEQNPPDQDAPARPSLEEVPSPPPDPVSPDDFWGERSAALQSPLEEADRAEARNGESRAARRRRRAGLLAAGTVGAMAVVILTLSLLGQSSSPGKARVNAGVDNGGGRGTLWPLPAHQLPAVHRMGRSRHRRPKPRGPSRAQPAASVAVNYVREQPALSGGAAGGGGSTAGTDTSPAAPSGPSPITSGGTTPLSGAGSTSPNSESSSSRNQSKTPAFGAGGALGPGHSPTG